MSEYNRVGLAIRKEFKRQWDNMPALSPDPIFQEMDWDALGKAAIRATEYFQEMDTLFHNAADTIKDYDKREASGEDMSNEIRPRMPGGSDW